MKNNNDISNREHCTENHDAPHAHQNHCHCGACGHSHLETHDHEHCDSDGHCHHSHCGCSHNKSVFSEKTLTARMIISAVLFVSAMILEKATHLPYIDTILYTAAYIIVGYDVILHSAKNIIHGKIFDENLLMTIASIGAFLIGERAEGAAVMLLYQFGEKLQDSAVDKSERSIEALLDVRAEAANVERNGTIITLPPENVLPGEIVIVKTGEKVPLDGIVSEGASTINTAALTGESMPISVKPGSEVMGGSINNGGLIKIKVTKNYNDSAVSKILEFVKDARAKKPKAEKFITKFARYYTPVVTVLALATMLIPPLFDNYEFMKWIERGLVFLVVSCPCALVISIPLGFFAAMGAASKQGILIKGGEYIEQLANLETAVFDKTGTLTEGVFTVTDATDENTLEFAAYCEYYSNHPIARAITDAYAQEIQPDRITDHEELAGYGIRAVIDGEETLAGNASLMKKYGIEFVDTGAQVYIARGGKYTGSITVADKVKKDSFKAVKALKNAGITTVMLTGDRKEPAEAVTKELGIDIVKSGLLPHEKALEFEKFNGIKAFVGDGINDAPVIAAANIGFAMGGIGSDSAVETADAVILTDEPSKVALAHRLSKRAMFIIKENIVFAISVKLIAMLLSVIGVPNMMWFAIFADVGTAMIAIANAMRIMYLK